MPELQVRLPYQAWTAVGADPAEDRAWEEPSDALMNAIEEALSESGLGEQDDPDHGNGYIAFFLDGDDVPALAQLASDVLARHGVLAHATAVIVNLDADDTDEGTETVVQLPEPRQP